MRGLRTQLIAVVVLAVAAASATVAALTIPGAPGAIRDRQLEEIERDALPLAPEIGRAVASGAPAAQLQRLVRRDARAVTARVTVAGVAETPSARQTFIKADSAAPDGARMQFPAALTAAGERRRASAVEPGRGGHIGQVAIPLIAPAGGDVEAVLVVSRPIGDDDAGGWLGRRLAAGAAIGLLIALAAGLLFSWQLERRIARLSSAAGRAAAGDLATPFPTEARSEFGGLGSSLEEMRRQLAELDQARKRFIATASHELRTPLFSLGGFLELLEDEDLDEADRRRFTGELRQQVMRLQDLATDLLDLSRMEAGSFELNRQEAELGALARSVAAEFEPAIAGHDAHLELRLPDEALHALCDPDRVRQVLRILIANAITHTPKGTDVVVAAALRDGRPRLSVADHGPGISRAVLPTIFEPFATTDDMQGTGLGLAIARELASRMHGELRVESRPGLTRFTLDLEAAVPTGEVIPNSG
ncbi:MAG: ATP-binding protein [Baekduia sp.]